MEAALAEARKLAELRGFGPARTRQLLDSVTSRIHTEVVEALLANEEPRRARAYLDTVKKGELEPRAQTQLARAVRTANLPEDALRIALEIAEAATENLSDGGTRFSMRTAFEALKKKEAENQIDDRMMRLVLTHLERLQAENRSQGRPAGSRRGDDLTLLLGADSIEHCGLSELSTLQRRNLSRLLRMRGIGRVSSGFAGLPADRDVIGIISHEQLATVDEIVSVLTPMQCREWMTQNSYALDLASLAQLLTDSQCERLLSGAGWSRGMFGMSNKDGRDALWFQDGTSRFYTTDLPFGFPSFMFREGQYWCKTRLLSGPTEMIVGRKRIDFGILNNWMRF